MPWGYCSADLSSALFPKEIKIGLDGILPMLAVLSDEVRVNEVSATPRTEMPG